MSGDDHAACVVVGAGQAGAWTALTLREAGFAGRILLVGAEAEHPYERPPLSKSFLTRGPSDEGALLTPERAAQAAIELRLGASVVAIDRAARHVRLRDGAAIPYAMLFLATGGAPLVPGFLAGLPANRRHVLRTRADARRLSAALETARRVLVLGGGWIGLEVAAACRARTLSVTLVEAADRLCARSLPDAASAYLLALHRRHGVAVMLGTACVGCETLEAGLRLSLADGRTVSGDLLVVGVGIRPETSLAAQAGLEVADGIVVDEAGRTGDPAIFAVGDVARFPSRFAAGPLRLESWAHAQNHAIATARAALGAGARYDEVPWFWSDQYGQNLQVLGLPVSGDTVLARGAPAEGSGLWMATGPGGRLAGFVAVNAGRDLRQLRRLASGQRAPDPSGWIDPRTDLRQLRAAGAPPGGPAGR